MIFVLFSSLAYIYGRFGVVPFFGNPGANGEPPLTCGGAGLRGGVETAGGDHHRMRDAPAAPFIMPNGERREPQGLGVLALREPQLATDVPKLVDRAGRRCGDPKGGGVLA